MKICLASIHPRLLSGQIEGLIALARSLESLGHEVNLVSVFGDELRSAGPKGGSEGSGGQGLAPRLLQIGNVLKQIVVEARNADVLHLNLPTPAFTLVAVNEKVLPVEMIVSQAAEAASKVLRDTRSSHAARLAARAIVRPRRAR